MSEARDLKFEVARKVKDAVTEFYKVMSNPDIVGFKWSFYRCLVYSDDDYTYFRWLVGDADGGLDVITYGYDLRSYEIKEIVKKTGFKNVAAVKRATEKLLDFVADFSIPISRFYLELQPTMKVVKLVPDKKEQGSYWMFYVSNSSDGIAMGLNGGIQNEGTGLCKDWSTL